MFRVIILLFIIHTALIKISLSQIMLIISHAAAISLAAKFEAHSCLLAEWGGASGEMYILI